MKYLGIILRPAYFFRGLLKLASLAMHKYGPDNTVSLEVGGYCKRKGWIVLGLDNRCDVIWDLRFGLPFRAGACSRIYSSHLLEHFTHEEILQLLSEYRRVLAPGGIISICVPNARLYIESYCNKKTIYENGTILGYRRAFYDNSMIDYVNYIAYMDGHHKYMFDEENILVILRKVGFVNVVLREYEEGLDSKASRAKSLYVQAVNPFRL